MQKKLNFVAIFAAILLTLPLFAETKIATIDLEKLVRLHPNTQSDKTALEATLEDYKLEVQQLENASISTRKAFEAALEEAQNPALSEKAKIKAKEDAEVKYKAAVEADKVVKAKQAELQRSLTETEVRYLRRTIAEIEKAVAGYAKENGIGVVLPTTGAKLGITPSILWSDGALDITDKIMGILKIEEPKDEMLGVEAEKE